MKKITREDRARLLKRHKEMLEFSKNIRSTFSDVSLDRVRPVALREDPVDATTNPKAK